MSSSAIPIFVEMEDKENPELLDKMIKAVKTQEARLARFPKIEDQMEAIEKMERENRNYVQIGMRYSVAGIYLLKCDGSYYILNINYNGDISRWSFSSQKTK